MMEKIVLTISVPETCFALKIRDAAMEPLFPQGCTVVCDFVKKPFHGSYVVVCLKGVKELVLRKLLQDIDVYYIKPLNEDFGRECTRRLGEGDKIIATAVSVHHDI